MTIRSRKPQGLKLLASGKTQIAVARKLGVSRQRAHQWAQELQAHPEVWGDVQIVHARKGSPPSPGKFKGMRMLVAGKAGVEVAQIVGVRASTVYTWVKEIKTNPTKWGEVRFGDARLGDTEQRAIRVRGLRMLAAGKRQVEVCKALSVGDRQAVRWANEIRKHPEAWPKARLYRSNQWSRLGVKGVRA